jgi:LuxR family maltose regulon positive regulatory protein
MYAPILSTKLHRPPTRPGQVNRWRLVEKLQAGLDRRLTLVSAPPGFGKTTLVRAWLRELDCPGAWLSLDPGDNDPARFFAYLAAAAGELDPSLGLATGSMLSSLPLPDPEVLVTALLNDLALYGKHAVLVLDDYHTIHNPSIHNAIAFFVERQPRDFHLVLVTREDPPLPLPRLRGRGEISEIREADLRFSLEESRAFLLGSMGLDLSPQSVSSLVERTEGWIAGLQMAALALRSPLADPDRGGVERFIAEFHGDDRYVMDYLMEEVFRTQPPAIQQFLLQTSLLDRMSAPLCDYLRGDNGEELGDSAPPIPLDSQSILEYLERSNLFLIPLDNRREWYRYHHLFADLLRYRLQQGYPQHIASLHRRASQWFRQAGNIEEAMKHALALPDRGLAAEIAEENVHRLINASRLATCLAWIPQLPDDAVLPRAYLCSGLSWASLLDSQLDLSERYLRAGEAALDGYEPVYLPLEGRHVPLEEVRGQLTAIRAYRARLAGAFPEAAALSQRALAELPAEALAARCVMALNLGLLYMGSRQLDKAREACQDAYELAQRSGGNPFVAITALSELGAIAILQGDLAEGVVACERAIELGKVGPDRDMPIPAVGYAHGWLGAVYFVRDQLPEAGSHLQKALELVEWIGPQESLTYAYLWQARLALAECDLARAEAWLERAEARARQYAFQGVVQSDWITTRGRLALARGDIAGAERRLESQGISASDLEETPASCDPALQTRLPEYLLLGRLSLARGEMGKAERLLERVIATAEDRQDLEVELEALALRAVAASERRSPDRGLPYLAIALDKAAPQGYARPLLEAGAALNPLLRLAVAEDIQPAFAGQLLARLSRPVRAGTGVSTDGEPDSQEPFYLEPLTGREKQVLRLLAAGLSSTEIAEQLVLSILTTRSYIKTIYRKLDVHNREEALVKGRQLRLLENPPHKPPS